jgi:hypothetical protein
MIDFLHNILPLWREGGASAPKAPPLNPPLNYAHVVKVDFSKILVRIEAV